MAWSILETALNLTGIAGPPELLRLGENGVFLLPNNIVARVGRSPDHLSSARREVQVARWLTDTAQVPVSAPLDLAQPVIVDRFPVTFWHEVPAPTSRPSPPDLGRVLRALHGLGAPRLLDLPSLSAFARIEDRIESAPIAEQPRSVLRGVLGDLQELWASFATDDWELSPGLIHGDAHLGNLLRGADGRLALIDLESCCIGPREWDLAVTATYATSLGWITPQEYQGFVDQYGFDVTRSRQFPVMRRIRELRMTSWLAQNAQTSPAVAAEVEHRIACLVDDDLPRHWSRN